MRGLISSLSLHWGPSTIWLIHTSSVACMFRTAMQMTSELHLLWPGSSDRHWIPKDRIHFKLGTTSKSGLNLWKCEVNMTWAVQIVKNTFVTFEQKKLNQVTFKCAVNVASMWSMFSPCLRGLSPGTQKHAHYVHVHHTFKLQFCFYFTTCILIIDHFTWLHWKCTSSCCSIKSENTVKLWSELKNQAFVYSQEIKQHQPDEDQ